MKKLILLICSLLLANLITLTAQESEIALKDYFDDAEYFFSQEFYIDALTDYQQVYKRGFSNNANVNYKIGVCYLNIPGQKDKAIPYLEKAKLAASDKYKESTPNEKYAPLDAYLYLGNAYRINNQLDKAIQAYKKYKQLIPEGQKDLQHYTDLQIQACNVASEFIKKPVDVVFKNLGPVINSSTNDYKAVISGDGSTMAYMHQLPFYDAVYVSRKVNGAWSKPENITPQIMSDGDQYVCSLSYDGNLLFLSKEDEYNSDIYKSQYIDKRWTKSVPLGSQINTKFWESHASISKDGRLLYFTSNRKGGQGNMDIYVAEREPDGSFGNVKNLGPQINTDLNEDTPFITEDGNSLYFSSQSYASMGGYDIFVSHKDGKGGWTVPENLGYPINTTDDDLFYYPYNNGEEGYISRIKDDGYGGMDIYEVVNSEKAIQEELASNQPLKGVEGNQLTARDTSTADTTGKTSAKIAPPAQEKPDTSSKQTVTEKKEVPPVTKVKTIEITPVLFEFDRATLSLEGKKELDKVADLMKNNPGIKVQLIGYADALGPESYNLRLSESRAMSAMRYIISKSIDARRLKAVGKGETNFIAPNTKPDGSDNPEGRKYNRRVEFEINGVDAKTLMIKRINPVPQDMSIQKK